MNTNKKAIFRRKINIKWEWQASNLLCGDLQSRFLQRIIPIAEGKGIEPSSVKMAWFSRPLKHHCLLPSICGGQENRTLAAFTRNNLADCPNEPAFGYPPFSSSGGIRTHTFQGLNLLSLPVGLLNHLYSWRDSNSQPSDPKSDASANWATRVNEKSLKKLIKRLRYILYIKFRQCKASYHSIANNSKIKDYINSLFSL